jgi:hypothetical protein
MNTTVVALEDALSSAAVAGYKVDDIVFADRLTGSVLAGATAPGDPDLAVGLMLEEQGSRFPSYSETRCHGYFLPQPPAFRLKLSPTLLPYSQAHRMAPARSVVQRL